MSTGLRGVSTSFFFDASLEVLLLVAAEVLLDLVAGSFLGFLMKGPSESESDSITVGFFFFFKSSSLEEPVAPDDGAVPLGDIDVKKLRISFPEPVAFFGGCHDIKITALRQRNVI